MARRKMLENVPGFDEFLIKAYCDDKRTMQNIAIEIGCSPASVLFHLRRLDIPTRKPKDYEPTEKQRLAGRRVAELRKGCKLSDEAKRKISEKNKGRRKRDDYEFGGYEKRRDDGYICVYVPDHPFATAEGMVMKHRLVMEKQLGRYLDAKEVVHHINHKRDDNRIENLIVMTASEHMSMHMKERYAERRKNNAQ